PDGAQHTRLDDEIAFVWGDRAPDRRLRPGPFTAAWRGQLLVQLPGKYSLRLFVAGAARVTLDGKLLLDGSSHEPGWLEGESVGPEFGYHPLEVTYRRTDEMARLGLYWQSSQFELEPVAARWLFHDANTTPSDDFERGARLVRALRCAACHAIAGE